MHNVQLKIFYIDNCAIEVIIIILLFLVLG